MTPDLQALSREIAATGDAWVKPGVACVDPLTSTQWRRVNANGSPGWVHDTEDGHHAGMVACVRDYELGDANDGQAESVTRAIAAGPDLTDAATLGVLLGMMPLHRLLFSPKQGWFCEDNDYPHPVGLTTRAESIARAWLALHRKETTNG